MKKITLLSFCLSLLLLACKVDHHQHSEQATVAQKTYVKFAKVEAETTPIPISAIGRLGSNTELKLSFKIGGILASLRADEGDYVKAGSLLGTIRTNEIDAQVIKAERAVQKNKRDLARIEQMYADSVATVENVDDLRTLLQVSEADLEIAKFNQKFAKIISPVNGRVVRRLAEPNELVAPGQPVLLIATTAGNTYVMKVALSDKDINRVQNGSPAQVHFDAFPQTTFAGKISAIAESADPMTGTFEVDISLAAQRKRLRNGYIGRATIRPNSPDPYYKIPIQAIVEGDKKQLSIFVPTQGDSIAQELQVEMLQLNNHYVFVKQDPTRPIDKVITEGAAYLMDGTVISLRE